MPEVAAADQKVKSYPQVHSKLQGSLDYIRPSQQEKKREKGGRERGKEEERERDGEKEREHVSACYFHS